MTDPFDRWLADTLPDPREDAMEGRMHLAILRDRFARRRRNRVGFKFLAVAAPVLALVLLTGDAGDLGSDDFATVMRTSDDGTMDYVVSDFSGRALNIAEGSSAAETRELMLQRMANEGKLVLVEGWEFGGKANWSMTYVHEVGGRKHGVTLIPEDPPSEISREFAVFMGNNWPRLEELIVTGAIAPHSSKTVVLDGVGYPVQVYVLPLKTAGEVLYYRGDLSP